MPSYVCPFCNHTFKLDGSTYNENAIFFTTKNSKGGCTYNFDYQLRALLYKCPNCDAVSSVIQYEGSKLPHKTLPIYPSTTLSAKQFPEYVPLPIRQDYEEACSIVNLSPKSSATLSRRCIQGMIHDKFDLKLKNLNQEISALKDKIDPSLWSAINTLRQLGNIGAHMESDINTIVDIDPNEAEKLIRLVEILIKDWYIDPYEREKLLLDIVQINDEKQEQRKKTE